jgi:nicotinate-nucleotide adenylyltransferase
MRLGIFGGTFDPPHVGHTILAAESLYQLKLDKVLWVLTPYPPHKPGRVITSHEHRLAMLTRTIKDNPAFEISRVEIDRPPPHYAVETIRLLRQEFPDAQFVYLMGGDSLRDLPGWYHPEEFLRSCHGLGVMRRPGDKIEISLIDQCLPGIADKIMFVDAPLFGISASQIRKAVRKGGHYRYYVLPEVYEIIRKRGLYLDSSAEVKK